MTAAPPPSTPRASSRPEAELAADPDIRAIRGDHRTETGRSGADLVRATRPFCNESRARSWWAVISTLTLLIATPIATFFVPWWPLQLLGSLLAGLFFVRMFVIYHDFIHGAILRKSRLARAIIHTWGVLALTPPKIWKYTHNFHHTHNMKIETSGVGSFPIYTVEMWRNASALPRAVYRITRHPAIIALGYPFVFCYELCVESFFQEPKKNWDAGVAILAHVVIISVISVFLGANALLFSWLLPFTIAAAMGSYLFYAQHNFEGVYIQDSEEWTHSRASLESSSFMKFGPVMNWFTANIGYHHVHHLNPVIPYYRLPDAMRGIPELRNPVVTRFTPREIMRCFRLKLWDPQTRRMVSFAEADRGSAASAGG